MSETLPTYGLSRHTSKPANGGYAGSHGLAA